MELNLEKFELRLRCISGLILGLCISSVSFFPNHSIAAILCRDLVSQKMTIGENQRLTRLVRLQFLDRLAKDSSSEFSEIAQVIATAVRFRGDTIRIDNRIFRMNGGVSIVNNHLQIYIESLEVKSATSKEVLKMGDRPRGLSFAFGKIFAHIVSSVSEAIAAEAELRGSKIIAFQLLNTELASSLEKMGFEKDFTISGYKKNSDRTKYPSYVLELTRAELQSLFQRKNSLGLN